MYIVRIMFNIKDGTQATFEETASQVTQIARDWPGCTYFGLSVLAGEPTKYMLYEEWDNKHSADEFKASSARNDAVAKLAPTMASAPTTFEYQAEPQE